MKKLKETERKRIQMMLKNMDDDKKKDFDKDIFNHIIKLNRFIRAKDIFTYVSFNNEVNTIALINYSIKEGKNIYVPKVDISCKSLEVFNINSINQLSSGNYNILEPIDGIKVDRVEFDILFIPGLLFTKDGFRLGRGEGYFDRFLSKVKGYKIGLCYSFQIRESLPVEKHDIQVDEVISR